MNEALALRTLDQIMEWGGERSQKEFAQLSFFGRVKYDSYRGFAAGARFLESLAYWLQQFEPADRDTAYRFVQDRLIFLGSAQMRHLVALAFPEVVQPVLVHQVARDLAIPQYQAWYHPSFDERYQDAIRRTLVMGLSDGARIDMFRRANESILSNEQVCVATEINDEKWESLLDSLKTDTGDPDAKFRTVVLVDDFTGSGFTLLRTGRTRDWGGKLGKLYEQTKERGSETFADDVELLVHHYVGTNFARENVERLRQTAAGGGDNFFRNMRFTFGMVLPDTIKVGHDGGDSFAQVCEDYYDSSIMTDSLRKGGDSVMFGFRECRLPLVFEHNTPNNSVALIWGETEGVNGPAMRPLFRRRHRHV